jgi:hypothetical protein
MDLLPTTTGPTIKEGPMSRAMAAAVGATGLVSVAGFSAYAVAAKGPTKRPFTETTTGAEISAKGTSFESAYKVRNSLDGAGAAIQDAFTTGTTFPLSGNDAVTTYFANGVLKTKDTFKLGCAECGWHRHGHWEREMRRRNRRVQEAEVHPPMQKRRNPDQPGPSDRHRS